jgi:pimeloyl-ACP methyl ester carboxylesterase
LPPDVMLRSTHAFLDCPGFDATMTENSRDPFADGNEIGVPVTIAWGTRDLILLPRQARRAARALPHARVVPLPGCGHVPFFEDPPLVAQVLLEGAPLS